MRVENRIKKRVVHIETGKGVVVEIGEKIETGEGTVRTGGEVVETGEEIGVGVEKEENTVVQAEIGEEIGA